mgnify:CR=1 FL=1
MSGGFSHPSISDDGSGNVVITSGKFVGHANYHMRPTASGVYLVGNGVDSVSCESTAVDINANRTLRVYSQLQVNGGMKGLPTTAQQIDLAGDTIAPTEYVWKLINDTGSSITLTSTPHMSAGDDGEIQILINTGADDIVLQDDGTLSGSDIFLKGAETSLTLKTGDAVMLAYNTDTPGWGVC